MVLACAIILLHAVVPHHHHDCDHEMGLVLENELSCQCDHQCDHHEDHHSHHPFDTCKLQDLLSHLVLSTKEDETYWALNHVAVVDLFADNVWSAPDFNVEATTPQRLMPHAASLLPSCQLPVDSPLRAPPVLV